MTVRRSSARNTKISFNTSGDNIIIPSPASGPLNVYGLFFTVTGATNIIYRDSVVGDLSGSVVFTGNGSSQTLPLQDEPYFQLPPGSNFVINSSNAVGVGGTVWYTTG